MASASTQASAPPIYEAKNIFSVYNILELPGQIKSVSSGVIVCCSESKDSDAWWVHLLQPSLLVTSQT
jgi:hypothetical protein